MSGCWKKRLAFRPICPPGGSCAGGPGVLEPGAGCRQSVGFCAAGPFVSARVQAVRPLREAFSSACPCVFSPAAAGRSPPLRLRHWLPVWQLCCLPRASGHVPGGSRPRFTFAIAMYDSSVIDFFSPLTSFLVSACFRLASCRLFLASCILAFSWAFTSLIFAMRAGVTALI